MAETGQSASNVSSDRPRTPRPGLVESIFFFPPPLYVSQCFDIMSKLYVLLSNIWGAPLNQRDLTTRWANLHCVNTKWVIWKRCWHVGLCRKRKTNAFTYSVNAPVPCNVHPHIHSLSFPNEKKKQTKTRRQGHSTPTGSMKKSLSP